MIRNLFHAWFQKYKRVLKRIVLIFGVYAVAEIFFYLLFLRRRKRIMKTHWSHAPNHANDLAVHLKSFVKLYKDYGMFKHYFVKDYRDINQATVMEFFSVGNNLC